MTHGLHIEGLPSPEVESGDPANPDTPGYAPTHMYPDRMAGGLKLVRPRLVPSRATPGAVLLSFAWDAVSSEAGSQKAAA